MCEKNTKISTFYKQCFVTAAVGCSVISSCGCAMGFLGIMLPQLTKYISLTNGQTSWVASADTMPTFLGTCLVPVLMAHYGRRAALFAVILLTVLSWTTLMLATSYEALLTGMMLLGTSNGMMMPLQSVFIGESTSPRHRGAFLTINSLAQLVGVMVIHLIGSIVSYKMAALFPLSFSVISLIMTAYSPETPSWLATTGKYDECRKNFMWLRRQEELPELERMIEASKRSKPEQHKLKEIFAFAKRKEFYKPTAIMCALFCMVNFSDATLLTVYPIPVLHELMGAEANAAAWMVALDAQNLVFNSIAVYVIHKVKRRSLLFATGAICILSQLGTAAYLAAKDWMPYTWIPGVFICMEMFGVSMGLLPLCSVIGGEVFPLRYRSYAESISLLTCLVPVFVILKTFPDLMSVVGLHGVFGLYAGVMTTGLVVAWFLLPETSCLTLQQIEEHFKGEAVLNPGSEEGVPLTEIVRTEC